MRQLMHAFFQAVGSEDIDAIEKALEHWMQTERRFPCPADIRDLMAAGYRAAESDRLGDLIAADLRHGKSVAM